MDFVPPFRDSKRSLYFIQRRVEASGDSRTGRGVYGVAIRILHGSSRLGLPGDSGAQRASCSGAYSEECFRSCAVAAYEAHWLFDAAFKAIGGYCVEQSVVEVRFVDGRKESCVT